MQNQLVETVLREIREDILNFAARQSVNLSPWFIENENRLAVVAQMMGQVAAKSSGASPPLLAEQTLGTMRTVIAARLPQEADWFSRNQALLQRIAEGLAERLLARPAETEPPTEKEPPADAIPPDLRSAAERTAANLRAIHILASGSAILPEERELLRQYSGWGGLSIKGIEGQVPEAWLPEKRGLIHEYYTPTRVARAIAEALRPRLADLVNEDGQILALEPSAGIGRLIEALSGDGFDALRWHACEYSRISGQLLSALRPDVDVSIGPLEKWVQEHAELQGELGLVVSNPPYGERGAAQQLDPDRAYQDRRAYVYQMRRTLDFLRPGGIGVYLVPSGFLTGMGPEFIELRRKVLRRHHLMAAFRLPSESEDKKPLFPGALLVTDVLFFRARGGELADVVAEDQAILEGRYFAENPTHILGQEIGREGDEDDHTSKPRWGYQVRGTFERLPAFEERPMCRDCTLTPYAVAKPKRPTVVLTDSVREALQLARRTSQYLSEIARGEPESTMRAAALHADLKEALLAWHGQPTEQKLPVAAMTAQVPELQPLFSAMTESGLLPAIENAPAYSPRFLGALDDIPAQADFLYGQKRAMTLADVVAFHRELGGSLAEDAIRAALIAGGFCFDESQILPERDYYSGALWDRYDRARAAAERGDAQAAAQASRLLQAIAPATFAEIQVEPRLGWLPLAVITAFCNHLLKRTADDSARYTLERKGSLLTLEGVEYADLANASKPLQLLLGYLNHDMTYFRPRVEHDEDLEAKRQALAQEYRDAFTSWIEAEPEHQAAVVEAFNRHFRGWVPPTFPQDPLPIARWNAEYPLYPYQNAGVRRLNANHGGGLFYDVGLGKTRTMLATLALARQQGWARRPVICVPGSVAWNWIAEIERVLPDYRVALIGSKRKILSRGARKGQLESETDTPRERADKWERFKAGLYDVAIVTYSALPRTRMRMESLLPVIRETAAIQREIGFQLRSVESRIRQLSKKHASGKLTPKQKEELEKLRGLYGKMQLSERREAIKSEKEETFAARILSLPENQQHDPGLSWEDLGIDWLAFDESHIGKNLWTVGAREGGEPRFLGAPQEGSDIAWQMFFRSYLVRKNVGGSGIHLADATPAKNSPLEFLSLLSFIDDQIWARLGIADPEQYLTQYLKIENRLIQDTNLEPAERPCVVGFQNLDQLRDVLFRYGEFRTAKQVGLKIPEPKVVRIDVDMDAAQEAKYEQYLREYQNALSNTTFNPAARFQALGLLQRMALVAVHAELDGGPPSTANAAETAEQDAEALRQAVSEDISGAPPSADSEDDEEEDGDGTRRARKPRPKKRGWTFSNAHLALNYSSPKLDTVAELVVQRQSCGHIIFAENTPAHWWIRERLVAAGVPRERIAILNGETTPTTLSRQRVAEGFTADDAIYDVIIANRIAYEGLNLQTRTCAIYHLDLPYEPATLQQRNGRGQRQGNRYDIIHIYYILSKRSMDMARFQLIHGKREWMAALIESAASETNNPAAQADMTPEDWLMYLSRDPEQTAQLLAAKQAKQREDDEKRQRKLAWATVRAMAIRTREVQNADLFQRTRLMEEVGKLLDELNAIDAEVWPWKFIGPHIARNPALAFAPTHEGAVWQGGRYRRLDARGQVIDAAEFGRVLFTPRLGIGYREGGSLIWEELSPEAAQRKWSYTRPFEWQEEWPPIEEELRAAVRDLLFRVKNEGVWVFKDARFDLATHTFLESVWAHFGKDIVSALAESRSAYQIRVPVVAETGLVLGNGAAVKDAPRVLPFTEAGYQEFLSLAPKSALKWTDLELIAEWWWGRHIPRNLLVGRTEGSERKAA
ncbi:MAG: SNF2-related protein [Polyangia bacterium]